MHYKKLPHKELLVMDKRGYARLCYADAQAVNFLPNERLILRTQHFRDLVSIYRKSLGGWCIDEVKFRYCVEVLICIYHCARYAGQNKIANIVRMPMWFYINSFSYNSATVSTKLHHIMPIIEANPSAAHQYIAQSYYKTTMSLQYHNHHIYVIDSLLNLNYDTVPPLVRGLLLLLMGEYFWWSREGAYTTKLSHDCIRTYLHYVMALPMLPLTLMELISTYIMEMYNPLVYKYVTLLVHHKLTYVFQLDYTIDIEAHRARIIALLQ